MNHKELECKPLKICIVAGEISGDQLGAGLIKQLKCINSNIEFTGIGGELMQDQGLRSIADMNVLSVMGFIDVAKNLFKILSIRKKLKNHIIESKPDIYIGVDAPDFNLNVEYFCKKRSITTIHYVSPSIWVWRIKRVFKIKKSVDHVFCIFPFEVELYSEYQVNASYVGHRLAYQLPINISHKYARDKLSIDENKVVISLLPGSRHSEIEFNLELYLQAVKTFVNQSADKFVIMIPVAKPELLSNITKICNNFLDLDIRLLNGKVHSALHASDVAIVTSGTATLDAMMCHCPLIACYRLGKFSYWLASNLIKTKYISLVNIIYQERVITELIQDDLTVDNIVNELGKLLIYDNNQKMRNLFIEKHKQMFFDSDKESAKLVLEIYKQKRYL